MKKLLLFFMLLFFASSVYAEENVPGWLNNPSHGCMLDEICVVGSGETLSKAKLDGQNEMLRFFENDLESSYSSYVSSKNDTVSEAASEKVTSATKGIVSGSIVKKMYYDKLHKVHYVQIMMNREDAKDTLRSEMTAADKKMETLLGDKNKASISALKELYSYREALNKRYTLLNKGTPLKEKVTYSQIFDKKKNNAADKVIGIHVTEPAGNRIASSLKKMLLENGFKVSSSAYNYDLKGELTVENEHFNVKGFIKNFYVFNLEAVDIGGDTVGTIYITTSETGRDEYQTLNKALARIVEEIKNNFDDLGI